MINGQKVVAIIPARAGSKRLKNKNILDFNGKPLIVWTIDAAKSSRYVDSFIVSTDSERIIEISKKNGAEVPFVRPEKLSSDTSSTISVIQHAVEALKLEENDIVIILQPTSPLRTAGNIDSAVELLINKKSNAIVSVCKCSHSPLWSNTISDNGSMKGFIREDIKGKRSQELPNFYQLNGAIYVATVSFIKQNNSINYDDNVFAYIMDRCESIDIDDDIDFEIAKMLAQRQK